MKRIYAIVSSSLAAMICTYAFSGCGKSTPATPTADNKATHDFLIVGKTYEFDSSTISHGAFTHGKVLSMPSNGWVKIEQIIPDQKRRIISFLNLNLVLVLRELSVQTVAALEKDVEK